MKMLLFLLTLFSFSVAADTYKSGNYKLRGKFSFKKRIASMNLNQGTNSSEKILIDDFPIERALLANKRNIEVIVSLDQKGKFKFIQFVRYFPQDKTLRALPKDKLPASIEKMK